MLLNNIGYGDVVLPPPQSRSDHPGDDEIDHPPGETIEVNWLAERLPNRSAGAIAADVGLLVKHEEIAVGSRLPSVRELAAQLRVSPATVSSAWQRLRARNVLAGNGRAGTVVIGQPVTPRPVRYESEGHYGHGLRFDLGVSVPDPALLPDVQAILRRLPPVPDLNGYERTAVVPSLAEAIPGIWPYAPRSLLVANGGYEALMLSLHTFVQAGDYVLAENPSPPRMLDIIESTGARLELLERDEEGIRPESLARGLRLRPAAIVLQPSVHNPAGTAMTERRRDILAELCNEAEAMIIEDDGFGCLAPGPVFALAERCPRGLYIRSFSKSHGPDLRMGVLEGAEELVDRVRAYRGYGSAWTSRILQEVLAAMLRDPDVDRGLVNAKAEYVRRREALASALRQRGINVPDGSGLDLWLKVPNERFALVTLAAHGVAVASGSRFGRVSPERIRVSTSRLPVEEADAIADILVQALTGHRRRDRG